MPHHPFCTVSYLEGCKPKNLLMTRGNLQVFFFTEGKPKVHQMVGGKSHLTLIIMLMKHALITTGH